MTVNLKGGRLINSPSTLSDTQVDSSVLKICGGYSLEGNVRISGAKNSALVIMAGALLCSGDCR
ncbi:MAG: UDP-N-acetylglucosamine 1-carboxyvinyltransferase, partial [Cylindrospermopsis raciborskii 1523720]|nr:UDP-N-acetylglucosamine 1-carboxyvinyltransferase [Cylindrospermopsis raciborskii]